MKCKILHEMTGRLRVHLCCGRMTLSQADVLEYYLLAVDGVQAVKVYDRTQDAVVLYEAERGSIIRALAAFSFAEAEAMELQNLKSWTVSLSMTSPHFLHLIAFLIIFGIISPSLVHF